MKSVSRLCALLLLTSTPAFAETQLEVDKAACDHLVTYVEPPGVEYQPGVDAYGNPVAPADLNGGSQIKLPTKFTIPITDYLYTKLSSAAGTSNGTTTSTSNTPPPNPSGVLSPALTVGVVTFDTVTQQVTFNGQPLNGDPDGALGQLCRKQAASQQ